MRYLHVVTKKRLLFVGAMLCLLAVLKGLWDLAVVLLLEMQGPVTGDVLLYTLVGRGILNGLVPYIDLFEARPPGMFLLTALSLVVSSGEGLMTLLEVIGFTLLPLIVALFAFRESHSIANRYLRSSIVAIALLLGIFLTLYTEEISGALESESFGAFFSALYVWTIAWSAEGKMSRLRTVLASVFLLFSVGIKEPFLLTNFAAALVLAPHPRHLVRTFVIPLGLAALSGLTLLFVLGYLQPFFSVYLPVMLGTRLDTNAFDPLLLRSLSVRRIYAHLVDFASNPLFGWVLLLLWGAIPILKSTKMPGKDILWTLLLAFLAALSIHELSAVSVASYIHFGLGREITGLSLERAFGVFVLFAVALGLRFRSGSRQASYRHLVLLATAVLFVLLLCFAIGLGGSYNNYHFAFAIPGYLALVLLFIRYICSQHRNSIFAVLIAGVTLLAACLYQPNQEHLDRLVQAQTLNRGANASVVEEVDALLDACNFSRYISLNTHQKLAFAKHSPIGPMAELEKHDYLPLDHQLYLDTYERIKRDGKIMLLSPTATEHPLGDWLIENFTADVPTCAKPFLPLEGLHVLFRKN